MLTADLAAWLRLDEQARLLVMTHARRAPAYAAHARATVLTDPALLDGAENVYDAAVVDGVLESEPWDRWLLQRIHRALRAGAPILVIVPPVTSVASLTDCGFLAYACRQVVLRLAHALRPAFHLPGPVHRRYLLSRLVRKMEAAGYTAIDKGPGWPGWLARRAAVVGRKALGMPPSRKRAGHHLPALAAAREAWLSKLPLQFSRFRGARPSPLDPADWRDARVLVLSPHPDDELIGCGGTLCRMKAAGAAVTILQATQGDKLESLRDLPEDRRRTIRVEEAARVAAALQADLVAWPQEDARLGRSGEPVRDLARLLGELQPTHVFTPFLGDLHADHRALSRILAEALAHAAVAPAVAPQILQYEVWALVPANAYCDITAQMPALERMLFMYERAMRVEDFIGFCRERNLARALEILERPGYVEAFLVTSGEDYRDLAVSAACYKG